MAYEDLVQQARPLAAQSGKLRDRLIKLTVQARDCLEFTQRGWADDIGVSEMTVRRWLAYHDSATVGRNSQGEVESYNEWRNRTDPASTYEAHTARGLQNLPSSQRAQLIREALTDPDVARETFNAPEPDDEVAAKARMHAGNAISRHDQRVQDHLTEKRHQEAVATGHTDVEALYEVAATKQWLIEGPITVGKLARKFSEGATTSARMRQSFAGDITKAKVAIEWLEAILNDEDADIDQVLAAWAAES